MMKLNKWILLFTILVSSFIVKGGEISFFEMADAFFKKNVKSGLIDYKGVKADPSDLNQLLKLMSSYQVSTKDKNTQLAFYINAYNLAVIDNVVKHYPLASPLDRKSFFNEDKFSIAGKSITLNHLENEIVRPTFNDPRIHFALVCGAIGCPPIIEKAYKPDNVQQLLTQQTSKALNNPKYTIIESNKIQLTEIFNWYKQDFGNNDAEIIVFMNSYLNKKISGSPAIEFYPYNWKLNELK